MFLLSRKAGSLSGVVQDSEGKIVPGSYLFLQPDPLHGSFDPIHERSETADQNAKFTYKNLAPGKYRIAAWRNWPEPWERDAMHFAVSSSGVPVEVPESGDVMITVPLPRQ